jgi:hypothetical protein
VSDIPRRNRIDLYVPAETAIAAAVDAVEAMPADERLTDAVILLGRAKDAVADFIEGVPRKMSREHSLALAYSALQAEFGRQGTAAAAELRDLRARVVELEADVPKLRDYIAQLENVGGALVHHRCAGAACRKCERWLSVRAKGGGK